MSEINPGELRKLHNNEPLWFVENGSDLTMDGKSTPAIITTVPDGHFINIARGNRDFNGKAHLTAAAVNVLPALLDYKEKLETERKSWGDLLKHTKASNRAVVTNAHLARLEAIKMSAPTVRINANEAINPAELRKLHNNEPLWFVDNGLDLTRDGKATPTIISNVPDGHFLTFSRGNRNFDEKARLAAAAVNALPGLLDCIEELESPSKE